MSASARTRPRRAYVAPLVAVAKSDDAKGDIHPATGTKLAGPATPRTSLPDSSSGTSTANLAIMARRIQPAMAGSCCHRIPTAFALTVSSREAWLHPVALSGHPVYYHLQGKPGYTGAMFKKILCPIDLDETSLACHVARRLAQQSDAGLCLLHVIVSPPLSPAEPCVEQERELRAKLEEIARKRFGEKIPHEIHLWRGDPAAAIIRAARDLKADLVVMATHGRTGMDRLVLGSVTERVVRECSQPVLTVRPV